MTDSNSKPIYRIMDLSEADRPRERLSTLGAQALTNAELLAILLRVGVKGESAVTVGQRLLKKFGGLTGLHRAPFDPKTRTRRRESRADQSGDRVRSKAHARIPEERPAINSPADAAALVSYEMSALEQEHLRVMLLDRRNRVLETVEVYKGSVNSSQVRVGEIFKEAIRKNASCVVIIHNHPSGDPPQPRRCGCDARHRAGRQTARRGCTGSFGDRAGQVGVVKGTRVRVCIKTNLATSQRFLRKLRHT